MTLALPLHLPTDACGSSRNLPHQLTARMRVTSSLTLTLAKLVGRPSSVPLEDMDDLERNTIVIDMRERLWRMRVWPNLIQLFPSRELAEAHAEELAMSHSPPWTVIVRKPERD